MRLQVPEWTPSAGKVETEEPSREPHTCERQEDDGEKVDVAQIEALKAELYAVDISKLMECEAGTCNSTISMRILDLRQAHDFEKDDDTNFHIDFLTAGSLSLLSRSTPFGAISKGLEAPWSR